jgi:hypothetical protein
VTGAVLLRDRERLLASAIRVKCDFRRAIALRAISCSDSPAGMANGGQILQVWPSRKLSRKIERAFALMACASYRARTA